MALYNSSLKVVKCHAPIITDTITAARLFLYLRSEMIIYIQINLIHELQVGMEVCTAW
jgi:hypothetical protein